MPGGWRPLPAGSAGHSRKRQGWTCLAAPRKTRPVSFHVCRNGHTIWALPGTVTVEMSEAMPPRWNVTKGGCSAPRPVGRSSCGGDAEMHVGTVVKSVCGIAVCP